MENILHTPRGHQVFTRTPLSTAELTEIDRDLELLEPHLERLAEEARWAEEFSK